MYTDDVCLIKSKYFKHGWNISNNFNETVFKFFGAFVNNDS